MSTKYQNQKASDTPRSDAVDAAVQGQSWGYKDMLALARELELELYSEIKKVGRWCAIHDEDHKLLSAVIDSDNGMEFDEFVKKYGYNPDCVMAMVRSRAGGWRMMVCINCHKLVKVTTSNMDAKYVLCHECHVGAGKKQGPLVMPSASSDCAPVEIKPKQ